MCSLKHDLSIVHWNLCDIYPHFVFSWLVMHLVVLGFLYPLVCLRSLLHFRQQAMWAVFNGRTVLGATQVQGDEEAVKRLPEWMTTSLAIVYLIVPLGLVSFCTRYLLRNTISVSVSFAITMEMVCFRFIGDKPAFHPLFFCLDPTTNEIALLLYGNGAKRVAAVKR